MKTVVITGATAGIGFETAKQLAQKGYRVIHLARNKDKARKADSLIKAAAGHENVHHIVADLADLRSIQEAAGKIKEISRRIDALINNAGGVIDTDDRSKDGIEMNFTINHLGHFYLTNLLLNELLASKARVINVSSEAHKIGYLNIEQIKKNKGLTSGFKGYGDAKLCNLLFTKSLHERYSDRGLTAFSVHPGVVKTNFGHNMKGFVSGVIKFAQLFMITPAKGASTSVYLATKEGIEKNSGGYFKSRRLTTPSTQATSDKNAEDLWALSEQMIKEALEN
ncbi:MAG: SDR family NAD(P)-dependent oxidoreductase [Imperialibacter sp.]|uniref:SDR family NAD(P)-dependent oxidoreductase n=1 Tax=Imperialibacter sp. TaxID=2038411 RepID=UPI0030D9697A|tara:strand:+ start:415 stop:1257 length:843 start_codon:yes stop_codon:yes gene_type:complete